MNSINKTDHYFPISISTKNDLLRFTNADEAKTHVAYLGTSENFYRCDDQVKIADVKRKYKIPSDKRYIFSLCTIEPRKNLIFAVKGFIEFIKKHQIKDLIFIMGGTQWDFFISKLEAEIKGNQEYLPYILRIGYVDDEDLSPLYSASELTVYPSLYEGFGLPILEAMSCGTPVIVSNVSSCPEVAGDAALTIDPRNIDELVAAMEKIYFDKNCRETLCKKGLARAKTFGWKKTSSYMVDTMFQVVQADSSSATPCSYNIN
jgi:glycosyltransferase involved in cell wall biosynthesis